MKPALTFVRRYFTSQASFLHFSFILILEFNSESILRRCFTLRLKNPLNLLKSFQIHLRRCLISNPNKSYGHLITLHVTFLSVKSLFLRKTHEQNYYLFIVTWDKYCVGRVTEIIHV